MTALNLEQAIEEIYQSLANDNQDIDRHIRNLKAAMVAEGLKEVSFKPERLVQGNRAGRQLMKSYFKKRGVAVTFES